MEDSTKHQEEFRFKCLRCGTCCTDKNTLVNLTYSDILRIKNGLNLSIEEVIEIISFYIYDKELTVEDRKKMVISPMMTEKGLAFVGLRKDSTGSCSFYDDDHQRCKIYDLRPNFCRTFPFSFNLIVNKMDKTKAKIKMDYTKKGNEYCPGIRQDMPIINYDEWIKIGVKTLEGLNNNSIIIEKWNHLAEKGLITPTVRKFISNIFKLNKS